MDARYDAVVVGAGPNGLSAAVELVRHGRRVALVEGAKTIGGGARTAELTKPGFRHDVCSAVHPIGAGSPYLRSLPLEDYGLDWVHPEIPLAHPLDEGTVALYRSISDTAAGLGTDDDAYRRLIAPLTSRADALFESILGPLAQVPRHAVTMARFGLTGLRSAEKVAERFTTTEARSLWAGMAGHSLARLDARATSAIALTLAVGGHAFGFPFVKGGSQALSDALMALFVDLGGHVENGRWVSSLDELPDADAYLLDVSPQAALAIAGDRIRRPRQMMLRRWRHGPGAFKVDYALSGPVPWRDTTLARAGTIHVGGTDVEIAGAERAVVDGKHPERPFVLVSQPSVADPSRAPEGRHVLWAYTHVPNGSTVDMTEAIERQIERFAPGFRQVVIARNTMGPSEYEAYNPNNVGGDIGGGAFTLRQVLLRPTLRRPYRLGNGVFLCSASTPPGAGVHGMCGFHAARDALRSVLD